MRYPASLVWSFAVGACSGSEGAVPRDEAEDQQPMSAFVSLPKLARDAEDWPSAGRDLSHSGHGSEEGDLTVMSVAFMQPIWQHAFHPAPNKPPAPVIGTAVVKDGTVYIADAAGFVHARDLTDGTLRWRAQVSRATPDPVLVARFHSAPVVTDHAVFVGDSGATVFKLDRRTGRVLWSRDVDAHPLAIIQGDLAVFDTRLIVPIAGYENVGENVPENGTLRGSVAALDEGTGAIVWKRYTTSDQGLANPRFGAGVGVWSSPAIDPRHGRIYIGTGQFYEPGSALPDEPSANDVDYSDSLLSISLRTGEIVDAHQFTPGDVWGRRYPDGLDYDVGIPPTLFAIPTHGHGGRAVVGVGDKKGFYYVLDRQTLDVLWSVEVAKGSVVGGIQSTAAYADGVLYVSGHEAIDGTSLQSRIPPGQSATYLGTTEGILLTQRGARTNILALDAASGRLLWKTSARGAISLSPLIVAAGVLYQADINGSVRAFDARTGRLLAHRQLGGLPDGLGGTLGGNMITALSISGGRLLVSTSGFLPAAPSGVVAFGLRH